MGPRRKHNTISKLHIGNKQIQFLAFGLKYGHLATARMSSRLVKLTLYGFGTIFLYNLTWLGGVPKRKKWAESML